jgi:NAD(P)H-dependent FMN reductase
VSYGSTGGARAVEHLRGIMGELQIADVRAHVSLSMYTDFENWSVFKPAANHAQQLGVLLDQLVAWGGALKDLRAKQAAKA